jgi:hypothetical protein
MLKKSILAALLVCALMNTSCEKENTPAPLQEPASAGNSTSGTFSGARLGDQITSTSVDNPATYKGMYVDGANNIIGNVTKENNLINYAVNKGFNGFAFYGLRSVIYSSANYSKMASFLSRCAQNGITNFVYVVVYYPGSINGSDTTYIRKYNNSRSNSAEKFTGVNLEWEWWNGATSWTTYLATLKTYYNWTRKVSPNLSNEIYFGWFNNPSTMPNTMANELVRYCDRIVLHDYRTAPDVGYMKSRMEYLGQAAISQGKVKKIIVLFSAEGSFMGPYYSTHSFNDAYQSIVSQYTNMSFTGQSGLRIYGWQVYNYTYAKQYRP